MIKTDQAPYFVYIVRCRDRTLYTGFTSNVLKRVATHNSGKGAKYTRSRLPVTLVYSCDWFSKSAAMRQEAKIKKLTKAQKEALVKE
jgi:putative endonuclease